jgi:hypothetical protein
LTEPAFDQLLRQLREADVEFVLVGGLAVNAWGVVEVRRTWTSSWRLVPTTPFSIAAELASGRRVAIETDLGLLDVVQGLDGVPDYPELRSSAVETEILGVKVAVCSIDALREMKRAAGRPRDHVDLEDLDAAGN